jgi:competence protein ComEA
VRRFVLFPLVFSVCLLCSGCSRAQEISLTTVTQSYQGLIYVGGAVSNPGYYPLRTEDSLDDLVRAAGGLSPGADQSQVRLILGETAAAQRIDLNRAEAWLLEALPGVGETTAQAIVSFRNAHGSFRAVDDLLQVKGIGPALLEKVRPFVAVGGG